MYMYCGARIYWECLLAGWGRRGASTDLGRAGHRVRRVEQRSRACTALAHALATRSPRSSNRPRRRDAPVRELTRAEAGRDRRFGRFYMRVASNFAAPHGKSRRALTVSSE